MSAPIDHDVADLELAALGRQRIAWADANMPVLQSIRERFAKERPLDGAVVAACLHVTTETANLLRTLKAGGATVLACASNPLSTQDDVAAALVVDEGISTYAIKGEDAEVYYSHIDAVLDQHPTLTMDDGCDLVSRLHKVRPDQVPEVIAGTEETTTGVIRLRAMEAEGALRFPSWPSTTPTPSTCSTTVTGPGSPPSTASSGPPTCCWPESASWWPATATAARVWPAGPGATALR